MTRIITALFISTILTTASNAANLTVTDINNVNAVGKSSTAALIKLQVLLDRASASPGVIDGKMGSNTTAAIMAYERMNDLKPDGKLDTDVWQKLAEDAAPVAKIYELTKSDADQKLISEVPEDYAKMAKLDCLCFHRMSEAIAEKFHMDEDLLKQLNPVADFSKAGTKLLVTAAEGIKNTEVVRIEVDKKAEQVLGYDANDKLVFFTPASVGSDETPSPSGVVSVRAIAANPTYTLNASKNLNGKSDEIFKIAAGPNGPVGLTWIDLSKPTFGLHGTPDPSRIARSSSHGCVRMTNWDADELGRIVQIGAKVEFIN